MSLQRCTFVFLNAAIRLNSRTCTVRNIKRWVSPTLKELRARQVRAGPLPPQHRSSFLEWNYNSEIFAFGKRLGEAFDKIILKQALTHRSYIVQEELKSQSSDLNITIDTADNREMIEEGGRFIKRYLQETLPKLEPNVPKAAIEAAIQYLTSQQLLALVALHIGLKDLILSADFPVEEATMAATFKAIVSAVIRSSGEEKAAIFVKDLVVSQLSDKDLYDIWAPEKPMEYLMEKLTDMGISTEPEARLCAQNGTETILAVYQVGLYVDKKLLGIGFGENVDVAKDVAAIDAIQRLYNGKTELQC